MSKKTKVNLEWESGNRKFNLSAYRKDKPKNGPGRPGGKEPIEVEIHDDVNGVMKLAESDVAKIMEALECAKKIC